MRYFIYEKVNPVRVKITEYESHNALLEHLYYKFKHNRFGRLEEDHDIAQDIKSRFGVSWNNDEIDPKPYIITDKLGRKISPNILLEWLDGFEPQNKERRRWSSRWSNIWDNWLGFRCGPVPHTGVCHWGRSVGPKMNSEIRAAQNNIFVRAKRSFNRLITDRGDSGRKRRSRGWKNNKKRRQWM